MNRIKLPCLLLVLTILSGCGQTGDLYLPEKTDPSDTDTSTAVSTPSP